MTQLESDYLRFWTGFQSFVEETSTVLNQPKSAPRNHVHLRLNNVRMRDFKLCAATNLKQRWLKSELVVGDEVAEAIDELWQERRDQWQAAIGDGLYWHTVGIKGGKLAVMKHDVDPLDLATRSEHFRWFVETLETFDRTLTPVIRELVR